MQVHQEIRASPDKVTAGEGNSWYLKSPPCSLHFVLHTLVHTSAVEIPLPHIALISPNSNINVSAIDVKFWMSPKTYHTLIISEHL